MIKVTIAKIQLDYLNTHGFVHIFSLSRKQQSVKEVVNVYCDNEFVTKSERHFYDQFHLMSSLGAYGMISLEPYVKDSGFQTIHNLFQYLVKDKPHAHRNDLWVVYRLEKS